MDNDPLYQYFEFDNPELSLGLEDSFFDFSNEIHGESDEFYSDDEDDLGSYHYDDHYWRCGDGKQLFLKVKDSNVAESSVFSQLENPESKEWHYEALFFLLEELETFFLTWKRRTTHSFTIHLKSDNENTTGSDTDEERPQKSLITNAALSKRKYCESTRIFYSIFPKYDQFYQVYREIQGIKNRILDIRFALFLSSIPSDIVRQLPDELWLKIWRFSANPRDTIALNYQPYFQETTVLVEKNRLSQLFLSVFRLHKIMYKILFTFLLKHPPMQEMQMYSDTSMNIIAGLLWCHFYDIKRNLSRLNDLDSTLKKRNEVMDLKTKMNHGIFAFETVNLHGNFLCDVEQVGIGDSFFMPESQSPVWNASNVFFPNQHLNGTFLFLQKYISGTDIFIRFVVWNALSNSLEAIIYTHILLVDYISCCEYGYNLISFCGQDVAITLPSLTSDNLIFFTYKWNLSLTNEEQQELQPDSSPVIKEFKVEPNSFKYKPNSVSQAIISANGAQLTVIMYAIDNEFSKLFVYKDSKKVYFTESFPQKSCIKDAKGDKILIISKGGDHGNVIQLFDLSQRKILYTYVADNVADLCRSSVSALFDDDPDLHRFIIYTHNKRYYLVIDYSKSGDPIIVREGYISSEVDDCLHESLTFYKDMLFFIEKGTQLQDQYQYYIMFFDFKSTRILTPIYHEESSSVYPRVETYFAETKLIFFIAKDKLSFCKNRKTFVYLDFTADRASSVLKELEYLNSAN
ncbi:uncharacterized protein [Lepeophtheirus salmonis]|uniref:uncharacterized protein n=1 Tax=Lepeophtheirus salmonis TaxID=72036 RepID=UPI001AEB0EBF|nr:uncharacterized protein LOC121117726 [Lepeophtheirus salmonis]